MIKMRDILFEEMHRYYYHATLPENLPGIVAKGLIPSVEPHWGGDWRPLTHDIATAIETGEWDGEEID